MRSVVCIGLALGLGFGLGYADETGAGIVDRGIYPELSAAVEAELAATPPPAGAAATLRIDERHHVATLYAGDDPRKVYPYPLSAQARAELASIAPAEQRHTPIAAEDHDDDGIVDRLDVVRSVIGGVSMRARRK